MKYNIIDIFNNNITEVKFKKIINEKLHKIINLLEFSLNNYE